MKTFYEVAEWYAGAAEEFEDPSIPICQLFFSWQDNLEAYALRGGDELACGMSAGELVLLLGPAFPPCPIQIETGEPKIVDGQIESFGARLITPAVWEVSPSLNVRSMIHGFVVLYGVPDPAPWERRIVLL